MSTKDSINPVDPQDLSQATTPLAARLAQAMASLPSGHAPALVVDSPLAAAALKSALAATGWPGRAEGAPLPWCGTLEDAFEDAANWQLALSSAPPPRSLAMRRVGLAQLLLNHPGIGRSLGGSSRAALELAGRWVEMFDGWEWLEIAAQRECARPSAVAGDLAQAEHLAGDVSLLKTLQQASRIDLDRAAWMAKFNHAEAGAVWMCMGRSPSPKEKAMASLIFNVPMDAIRTWSHAQVNAMDTAQTMLAQTDATPQRMLIAAQTLEESAWAAAQTILSWRQEGMDDIGVVALDRKMLRRLRALLERAGEPFADRSGWALDTTVAASAVVGLNDLLTHQATTQSVLEWIHSPFVVSALRLAYGLTHEERRRIDGALRGYGRVAPVSLTDLVNQALLPCGDLNAKLAPAHARLLASQWSGQLIHAMQVIGLEAALAQDTAGQAVLASIQMLHADALTELAPTDLKDAVADASANRNPITSSLWHALLNESLAQSRFVEPVVDASVRVVSMGSLSWRLPKALLLLGSDAQRLPAQSVPEFFEPKRFAEMGLINPPEESIAEGFGQFVSVWASQLPIACVACAEKPDAEVEFSNWMELLAIARPALVQRKPAMGIIGSYVIQAEPFMQAASSPTVFTGELPQVISVTELQRLVDCPYQFYLQTLLGLSPMEPLQEESPATDLGSLIHQVLSEAKMHHASAKHWADWLAARIDERLAQPFFARRSGHIARLAVPVAIAAKLRADAMALIPRLSDWLAARASALGEIAAVTQPPGKILTEETVTRQLDELGVTVKGRIDRWEKWDHGSTLIDFKTSDPAQLKTNVRPGDRDVQLPLYAWLIGSGNRDRDAAYVAVRRDGIETIDLAATTGQPVADLAQATAEQVSAALQSIAAGEPLQLAGMTKDKAICERCNVRGICRRDDIAAVDSADNGSEGVDTQSDGSESEIGQ